MRFMSASYSVGSCFSSASLALWRILARWSTRSWTVVLSLLMNGLGASGLRMGILGVF